jgi:pepF/M3 family oligoendopeptidase
MQKMSTTQFPITWDLASLLPHPDEAEFRRHLDDFKARLQRLADDSDRLCAVAATANSTQAWSLFFQRYEEIEAQSTDLRAFLECHCAADAENKRFQQIDAELAALAPLRERIGTNVEFALKDVSPDGLERFLRAGPDLERNRYFFILRRRNAALRLPKDQELLAAELGVDGIHAWGRLYDRLSGALKVTVMERGRPVTKSVSQVQFDSPERAIRENNFFAADTAWQTIVEPCAEALNHISGTRLTVYKRLGLKDHLEAPLRYNRMSREMLETMWRVITERKGVLQEFLDAKANWLGQDRLAWYDQSAPLPGLPGQSNPDCVSYDDACRCIIEAFSQFSGGLGEFAKMALERRWIEAENRPGKRQGGFCTGFATAKQSRIFMTFTGSGDSMSTLAHELGHAYHSWVLRDEPIFLTDYPMNLAETASTFAEAVLGEHRLQKSQSDYERLSILEAMLGDAVAFCMNIHARFLFEDRFHQERAAGELTSQRLGELMEAAQREAYLGSLADDGWNPRFWASKLHFYITGLPFYNFPYTFGYLLSLGLYALGREMGADFPDAYNRLLIATGNSDAEDAVKNAFGFDLREPEFWQKSLDIIAGRVRQFTELSEKVNGTLRAV